jgi:hypothetical protein
MRNLICIARCQEDASQFVALLKRSKCLVYKNELASFEMPNNRQLQNKYRTSPAGVHNNQIHCYLLVANPSWAWAIFISEVVYCLKSF